MAKNVLVIGSGHLAYRVERLIASAGHAVTRLQSDRFKLKDRDESRYEALLRTFGDSLQGDIDMIYLLDDHDDFNLEFMIVLVSLNKSMPITASLFNENIAPHITASHPNVRILNPAKIAAPAFVRALDTETPGPKNSALARRPTSAENTAPDGLISLLAASFFALIVLSASFYHYFEGLSWINSFYFVIVTIATVGYGDINLLNSPPLSKIILILLIMSSTAFIWLIFSLTIDRIIKKRSQLALGRKRYTYREHVILCGLGRLGYFVAEELIARGKRLIIIEKNENSPHIDHFRSLGASVYLGNARLPNVLQDCAAANAKALFSVISDDYANIEIGLNARSLNPDIKLVLRIFDEAMAEKIKDNLDIHLTLSMSAIADEKFAETMNKK